MTSRASRLTRELLSLYIQYGADEFEAAARELREGKLGHLIADAADSLETAVRISKSEGVKPGIRDRAGPGRPSKRDILTRYLVRLKDSGGKTDTAVAEFAERILRRQVLNTPASVSDYMELLGISAANRRADRYQSIRQITEFLKTLPEKEAIEKIRSAKDLGQRGSSLQGWTDIIVRSEGCR